MDEFASRFRAAALAATEEILELVRMEAVHLSTGVKTPAQMRAADHPYAARHGHIQPPFDPVLVNRQGGGFSEAWRAEPIAETSDGFTSAVVNEDPKAEWLVDGTTRMLGRPIPLAVRVNTEAEARLILERHLYQVATDF